MAYALSDGETLVRGARCSVELHLRSPLFDGRPVEKLLERYSDRKGVFVTIAHYPTMTMRGMAGFPDSSGPLKRQIIAAARQAATADSRFVPLSHMELDDCVVGVRVISDYVEVKERAEGSRLRAVDASKDGVMVRYGFRTGMALHSVAAGMGWTKREMLEHSCEDAGLGRDSWKRPEISLYRLSGQEFREDTPGGPVSEIL